MKTNFPNYESYYEEVTSRRDKALEERKAKRKEKKSSNEILVGG
jgi:hypothetical protein